MNSISVGIMLHLMVLYLAIYTISCVGNEACPTDEESRNTYQVEVPEKSCSCNPNTSGTLRYYDNKLHICDGDKFVGVGDSLHEFGSEEKPAKSCNEIAEKQSEAKSGMYYLEQGQAVIQAYCYMDEICGSKGWTMIMKIDGAKSTFHYASPYWTNKEIYNIAGASGGLDDQETKLETYSHFSFTALCLGLKSNNVTNWMSLLYNTSSMYSLIADGEYRETNNSRKAWKSLITASSLQTTCYKEGFNTRDGFDTMARIGILGSNERQCENPESRIGFGTGGNRCDQDDSNTAGNEARCGADNGDKSIRGFGYIFAQTQVLQVDSNNTSGSLADTEFDSTLGSLVNPAKSCLDIKLTISNATNGLYHLILDGNTTVVYCHMDEICNTSGWTLIMKINGNKSTFHYKSSYWSDKTTYNPSGASGGLDDQETKLKTYSNFPFKTLCLGLRTNDVTNWMSLKYTAGSLYSLIANDRDITTNQGLDAWKRLIPGSSLQTKCTKEGFNINSKDFAMVRIGIVGNQESHCNSADSRIGFGTGGKGCGQDDSNTAGNEARCRADNGNKSIKSLGYIFAQEN